MSGLRVANVLRGRMASGALWLLALWLAAGAASAETLRVGKAGRDAFSFVPADVGQRIGLFRKHGLDLEIASFGGDARIQQAMAADGIDIGLGSGPGLAFIVKGAPVNGVAALADPTPIFALVMRACHSATTADGLTGRDTSTT